MPLEAVAINTFDAPLMRQMNQENELSVRIGKLFEQHEDFSNKETGAESAITLFETAFRQGAVLYVGMFNDKPIVVMGCFDDGQTDTRR